MVYRLASPGQLTGAVRHQGISACHAFELALLGHPSGLALTVLDDEGDPQQALANARTAIADSRVVAAIPHYSSMSALACVQTYHSAGLPDAIWGAGQDGITEHPRCIRASIRECQPHTLHLSATTYGLNLAPR